MIVISDKAWGVKPRRITENTHTSRDAINACRCDVTRDNNWHETGANQLINSDRPQCAQMSSHQQPLLQSDAAFDNSSLLSFICQQTTPYE